MNAKAKRLPVAEQIRNGLEEAIRHAKGEITLKTTILEMPDPPPNVGGRTDQTAAQERNVPGHFRPGAQCLDQGRAELGTRPAQAYTTGVEIDPCVSSQPVRPA